MNTSGRGKNLLVGVEASDFYCNERPPNFVAAPTANSQLEFNEGIKRTAESTGAAAIYIASSETMVRQCESLGIEIIRPTRSEGVLNQFHLYASEHEYDAPFLEELRGEAFDSLFHICSDGKYNDWANVHAYKHLEKDASVALKSIIDVLHEKGRMNHEMAAKMTEYFSGGRPGFRIHDGVYEKGKIVCLDVSDTSLTDIEEKFIYLDIMILVGSVTGYSNREIMTPAFVVFEDYLKVLDYLGDDYFNCMVARSRTSLRRIVAHCQSVGRYMDRSPFCGRFEALLVRKDHELIGTNLNFYKAVAEEANA